MSLDARFEVRKTAVGFPVIVPKGEVWAAAPEAPAEAAAPKRDKTRLTKESGARHSEAESVRIGGPFKREPEPKYITERIAVYDRIIAEQRAILASAFGSADGPARGQGPPSG